MATIAKWLIKVVTILITGIHYNKHTAMHNNELQKLRELLTSQDITKLSETTENFYGADIIVSDDPKCPDTNGWSNLTKVVTPYVKEVSWLLIQLRDIFAEELDYMNKYYFFGTLAGKANACIADGRNEKVDLLLGILDAANEIEL